MAFLSPYRNEYIHGQ